MISVIDGTTSSPTWWLILATGVVAGVRIAPGTVPHCKTRKANYKIGQRKLYESKNLQNIIVVRNSNSLSDKDFV